MKKHHLLLLAVIATAFGCSEREEDKIAPKPPVVDSTSTNNSIQSPPTLVAGFPLIKQGATSADLIFQADREADVYYLIAEKQLTLSSADLVREAQTSTLPGTIAGKVSAKPNESATQSITKLRPGSKYFSYFLATAQSDTSLKSPLQEIEFATQPRQDTSQFFSVSENRNVDFLLYKPEEVHKSDGGQFPIIIFLGGQGERAHGKKRINVIQNGLLPEYIHKGNDVPMIVMSVQHRALQWSNDLIKEAFDYAMAHLPVDKQRVYLVGTSAGAFGVWSFAQQYPERITAIVPISGGGNEENACAFKTLAIRAFHNRVDGWVPANESKKMVDAINKCDPVKPAMLQIFPDQGHNCWRRIFDQSHPDWSLSPNVERINIYEWLLQQRRQTSN